MSKVKEILWEPSDFDGAFDIGDPVERDYWAAISALQDLINTHLDDTKDADRKLMWRIDELINTLKTRV